jgi:GNAT superfamily N-acetyltransferase
MTELPGVVVRTATADDAASIAELAGELGYPSEERVMRARLIGLQASATDWVGLAHEPGGRALGWVHIARRVTLEEGEAAEILGLVVHSAAHRRGVGRRLIEAAEQWCRRRSLSAVRVRSNVLRQGAHEFYPSLGYQRSKSQHVYTKALS